QFDRPLRRETGAPQRANRFEAAEHADRSVEPTGIWNGSAVGPGRNRRERGIAAPPAGKGVPNRILMDDQRCLGEQRLQIRTCPQIHLAKYDTRDRGGRLLGERRERLELRLYPVDIARSV